jgi:nucleoside 2-deoxyribosyltransferase
MKIYLTHATSYDFNTELYEPMRHVIAHEHEVVFPHDTANHGKDSKETIKNCDVVLAEVSFPSTGQGIELGWANYLNKPIVCLYKKDSKPSSALRIVSDTFIEYDNAEDMIKKLGDYLSSI